MQARLHGADGYPEDRRDLLLPQVVDVVQDHHGAEVLGHAHQRLLHVDRQARCVGGIRRRRWLHRGQVVVSTCEQRCALALAEQYVIDAHGFTDDDMAVMHEHYTDPQLATLTTACATFDALARVRTVLAAG